MSSSLELECVVEGFWNSLEKAHKEKQRVEPVDWMAMYDTVFKFSITPWHVSNIEKGMQKEKERNYTIYNAYVNVLTEQSKKLERTEFLNIAASFVRTGAWLSRVFIPSEKLEPLWDVAEALVMK